MSAAAISPTASISVVPASRIGWNSRLPSVASPTYANRTLSTVLPRSGAGMNSSGGSRSTTTDEFASSGRDLVHSDQVLNTGAMCSASKNTEPP
ncbi:hypothetical protein JOF29_003467 [Kribbella aluminosa]|uniref:Uncharacterized protein n=1 Tax=Kribbella aluminosa TaxID=416017 RepID=A0ABS4UL79_9ACTN|nr:hypothetical protein [Kribbella aluminosa]MBP2352384.1 hypothetical protein [Kribbella aluminosa]